MRRESHIPSSSRSQAPRTQTSLPLANHRHPGPEPALPGPATAAGFHGRAALPRPQSQAPGIMGQVAYPSPRPQAQPLVPGPWGPWSVQIFPLLGCRHRCSHWCWDHGEGGLSLSRATALVGPHSSLMSSFVPGWSPFLSPKC
uniref:Uncharacterized protein n=1 Tax=Myotis myotis TaxID=51298 RepID=A0A7J7Z6Q4_MYOMY|nr:hypothetical protein mMyoMyo1_010726 [Myotis myotis]